MGRPIELMISASCAVFGQPFQSEVTDDHARTPRMIRVRFGSELFIRGTDDHQEPAFSNFLPTAYQLALVMVPLMLVMVRVCACDPPIEGEAHAHTGRAFGKAPAFVHAFQPSPSWDLDDLLFWGWEWGVASRCSARPWFGAAYPLRYEFDLADILSLWLPDNYCGRIAMAGLCRRQFFAMAF